MYLHQAAINLRVAAAKSPAAEERANRYLGRLLVLAPFPFDTALQTPQHPIADPAGDALPQLGLEMNRWMDAALARIRLL